MLECNGGCQNDNEIFFKVVCHGFYLNLPHRIKIKNGFTNKLYTDICKEPKHFARIAYNNEPGQFEVNNSKLVDNGYRDDRKSWEWEVLQLFIDIYDVEFTWIDCNYVWGIFDEELGEWTGAVGKVSIIGYNPYSYSFI